MAVSDPLRDFFVKKILAPHVYNFDVPGYISGKFYTLEGQSGFTRSSSMPENFFVLLEQLSRDRLGLDGPFRLYKASKCFGYNFMAMNKVSKVSPGLSLDLAIKFLETLYAEKLDLTQDLKAKYIELLAKQLFITRVNGHGESLNIGGLAGVCAYILDDFHGIDCGIVKAGDDYKLICGSQEALEKAHVDHLKFAGDPPAFDSRYTQFNAPSTKAGNTVPSLNKLLENRLFSYEKGQLKFSLADIRFAPVEVSLPYLLNQNIPDQIVYEAAKMSFAEISLKMGKQQNPHVYLANLLTALGYGVVMVEKKGETITFEMFGYPWYYGCESSKLPMLNGMIEGFLTSQDVKKATVDSIKSSLSEKAFLVSVSV
jgi:hypothetical protein